MSGSRVSTSMAISLASSMASGNGCSGGSQSDFGGNIAICSLLFAIGFSPNGLSAYGGVEVCAMFAIPALTGVGSCVRYRCSHEPTLGAFVVVERVKFILFHME